MSLTSIRFIGPLHGVADNPDLPGGDEALEVAESLLANNGFVAAEVAAVIAQGDAGGPAAPLVRAIPCGLYYFRDPVALTSVAEQACRLTHTDPQDVAAAVAMAHSVARLIAMDELNPVRFVREVADSVRDLNQEGYARLHGLVHPLRGELPFLCSDASRPLEILRAALYLFLTCQACDLYAKAERLGLAGTPVLPIAYVLAGCHGKVCRLTKPDLRILMVAEMFHKAAGA